MEPSLNPQVLIAGAGPTGLTLALELARRGVSFRIVDKAPEPFNGSRGKGVQPRSLEVFEDLGVIDSVLAVSAVYPPIRAYSGAQVVWEGRMHELHEPTPEVPYPNPRMIPQWRLEGILRERLASFGVRVELATELTTIEQDSEGVTATLLHAGKIQQVRARYLVGADGGRSFVRKQLGVSFEGETYETERMLIGDVQADGLDREHWHTWLNPETRTLRVGLCPLAGTNVFQFMAPFGSDEAPEMSLATMQRFVDAGTGRTDILLHDLSWMSLYRVNIRMVNRYRVGRVFLAGDAAHVHSPAGGQGLNTGVQDAYNLGWKLSQVLAGAPESLLDSYEEERLPIAAEVLGLSTKLHRKGVLGNPDANRRGPETQQLGLHYRGQSLARDERSAPTGVQAGDRAPDAPCHDGTGAPVRLFEVFRGPHFTLLAFGEVHGELVARINARYGPTVRARSVVRPGASTPEGALVDTGGHVSRAYGVEAGTLVLVRPDGYLGLISQQASGDSVHEYLRQITAGPAARQ